MEDKRETEKRKLQEQMAKEKSDILANIEYMKKVQEEKEKGKRMVSEFFCFLIFLVGGIEKTKTLLKIYFVCSMKQIMLVLSLKAIAILARNWKTYSIQS